MNSGTNWSSVNNGFPVNTVALVFIVSGTNLFAGTEAGGIFLSTDNGANWTPMSNGLTSLQVNSLAVSGSTLFAGTSGGVFLSTNNGANWSASNFGLPANTSVNALTVSDTNIFAGTASGVFLSTNNGTSWTNAGSAISSVNTLAVIGTNVFASTDGGGVFLSTNNGASWTAASTGLTNKYVQALAVSGSFLYAGTYGGGVFLSTNNASNWTAASTGLTNTNVTALAASPGHIFAGTYNGGVFLSTNSGSSWNAVNFGLMNTFTSALSASGLNLFAGTSGGVFLSTNDTSWTQINSGMMDSTGTTVADINGLAVSGSNLFAGTGGGVFLSTNNGSSWSSVSNGLTNSNVQALTASGSNLFAGTPYGGVFLSTNNGSSWIAINIGYTNSDVHALAISGSNLFAGTLGGGVFLSTDNGANWSAVNTGLTNLTIKDITVTGSNLFAGTGGGVFLSTNIGTSWSSVSNGLTNSNVQALTVFGTNLFAGTFGGVFLSTDNGNNWSSVSNGLTNSDVLTLTVSGTNLFTGTGAGVWKRPLSEMITEVPIITSFSPTFGPIGTTVTIIGTNFNTTAANDIIYFGAVKSTVTKVTSTSLSATVPPGTTYQPIMVTVNGFTAYTNSPFIVTFPSSKIIDTSSFAPGLDFTTGNNPYGVAIGDVDGDGKPDLIVTNDYSNTVSVFRNTSTSGSFSFAPKVDFTTGGAPQGVAICDVDGDGKPDMVVTNYNSNTVSVFRNTSTSGSITTSSFAPEVNFATGPEAYGLAIADMDGDGKPDIVVTNFGSNTVSVFRNTSTSGSITTSSFAPKVDFTVGQAPDDVAVSDMDGDGKPDLLVANVSSNTVSVFRNTSTSGSITASSFASRVDFTTGTSPQNVAIADIDGDSKPDMVVTNANDNTISVFRNTSTSGSITASSLLPRLTSQWDRFPKALLYVI